MNTHLLPILIATGFLALLSPHSLAQAPSPGAPLLPSPTAGEAAFWGWNQRAKIKPADGDADDGFGAVLSLDGDTALIAAWADDEGGTLSGSVYVFVRKGAEWDQEAKLMASDAAERDYFGWSVAIDGDTALVGARYDDDMGTSSGSAYVFQRSGTTWSQQAKLVPLDGRDYAQFGESVALAEDTAFVGASGDDSPERASGSVYVYVRSGSVWTQQAKLTAGDGAVYDQFGGHVSIEGDTAIIGATGDDEPAGDQAGSAYVFARSGSVWTQQAKLTAFDGSTNAYFGCSAKLAGDTALVGAPGDDQMGTDSGSVYAYVRSGTVWTLQDKLTASDGAAEDGFGRRLDLSGNTAIAASLFDDDSGSDSGSAYVFTRSGTTWSQQAKMLAFDGAADDLFGYDVALDGHIALAGAPGDDDKGDDSGSAYVFVDVLATVTHRNAGANPDSYVAERLPVLGDYYAGIVDLDTTGHSLALIVGYSTPLTLPFSGGQMILVNLFDPNGELLGQIPRPGPLATFDIPIPDLLEFVGLPACTQAIHFGGGLPIVLANAQDLVVGY